MRIANAFVDRNAPATVRVVLPYDARRKSRLLARDESGQDVGYVLPPGTVLRHGDKLAASDGAVIEVVAAVEPLLEVSATTMSRLVRAAYHIGNRHVALEVSESRLRLQRDHVLADMLIGLGCTVTHVEAPFDPEGGAYASHAHGGEFDPAHGPHRSPSKIHEFRR
jgi:urease accessory protein